MSLFTILSFSFFFPRLMAIQQCDLVLVHIYPQGEDTLVSDRPKKEVGSFHPHDIIINSDNNNNDDDDDNSNNIILIIIRSSRAFPSAPGTMWPLWPLSVLTCPPAPGVTGVPPADQRGAQRSGRPPPGHQTQHPGPAALWLGVHHHHKHPHEGEAPPTFHPNTPCTCTRAPQFASFCFSLLCY